MVHGRSSASTGFSLGEEPARISWRRVISTRDPEGRTVGQQWCTCGSLEKLIDANGNATSWERDVQGRVTKETRANGSFKTFTYETTTSRLRAVIDAKSQETDYIYGVFSSVQDSSRPPMASYRRSYFLFL